jgi:ABC-type multidrug transport system fused ATPase/permease subunit
MELLFALILLMLAGGLALTDPGDPASWLPGLLFFIASSARLVMQGSTLTSSLIKITNRFPSFEELVARVRETPDIPQEGPETRRIKQLDGLISVRGLCFSHEEGRPVLRDVDVDIPSDRLTFLVGASGSGKSTFIDILARLYLPDEGTITAAGHDYLEYGLTDWRRSVAYVSQAPVLFSGTVRENVTAGDDLIADDAVMRALALAGAESFVEQLPAGLDTVLGERGHGVSGGQRCRLAVARALVREPGLLILDESTSGIEPALERSILNDLKEIAGLGLLVVSHRRDNIDLADLVVELVDGRMVAAPSAAVAVHDDA